jgi:hypothetical protein
MQGYPDDPEWRHIGTGFNKDITGSNCYSFAVGDYRIWRPHKSVPGNLTEHVIKTPEYRNVNQYRAFVKRLKSHPFSTNHDWRTCPESVKRLITDGYAAAVVHQYMDKNGSMIPDSIIQGPFKKMPGDSGKRTFAMVVDSGKTSKVPGSTDFHFYVRYRMPLSKLYTVVLHGHSTNKPRVNLYQRLGVDPFMSDWRLREHLKRKGKGRLDPVRRACINTVIHAERFPDYALGLFVDPMWIFNMDESVHPHRLGRRYQRMKRILRKHVLSKRCKKVMELALKKFYEAKHTGTDVGLWAHKSGWATRAQNADGNGYLIIDPEKAERKHGSGFAYDSFCGYFKVLKGMGMSSPPVVDSNGDSI